MPKPPYKMTKLSDIRPYEKNPRIIPQAAVDAVARSIQAFGFRSPIIVDGAGVILAGHTRYRAAMQLGLEEVPVVWQSDITEIQARGYRIADNKVAEISTWDRDALDDEVKAIAENAEADVEALGLQAWELSRILDASTKSEIDDTVSDTEKRHGVPYEPYQDGARSGTVKGIPEKPKSEDADTCKRAVKIIFENRAKLEAAKPWLDKAVQDGEGVLFPCDP